MVKPRYFRLKIAGPHNHNHMGIFDSFKKLFSDDGEEFTTLLANGAVLLDVRTNEEFASGHAQGSINIPLQALGQRAAQFKGKEVVIVCSSGARAMRAKSMLQKMGISAHNAGAWENVMR